MVLCVILYINTTLIILVCGGFAGVVIVVEIEMMVQLLILSIGCVLYC